MNDRSCIQLSVLPKAPHGLSQALPLPLSVAAPKSFFLFLLLFFLNLLVAFPPGSRCCLEVGTDTQQLQPQIGEINVHKLLNSDCFVKKMAVKIHLITVIARMAVDSPKSSHVSS